MSLNTISKISSIEITGFDIELFQNKQNTLRELIRGMESSGFYISFTRKKGNIVFCSVEVIKEAVSKAFQVFQENHQEVEEFEHYITLSNSQLYQYIELISQKLYDSQKSNTNVGFLLESSDIGFYRLRFSLSLIESNGKKIYIPKLSEKLITFIPGNSEPIINIDQ